MSAHMPVTVAVAAPMRAEFVLIEVSHTIDRLLRRSGRAGRSDQEQQECACQRC
jgi:hypothetical protein